MSQPFARYLHPFDLPKHPAFEPEVTRAVLGGCSPTKSLRSKRMSQRPWTDVPDPSRESPKLASRLEGRFGSERGDG